MMRGHERGRHRGVVDDLDFAAEDDSPLFDGALHFGACPSVGLREFRGAGGFHENERRHERIVHRALQRVLFAEPLFSRRVRPLAVLQRKRDAIFLGARFECLSVDVDAKRAAGLRLGGRNREAGDAFGATPWQRLRTIELPAARASILAGITQCIMLSLSMVVIAALVGAGGLGVPVVRALNSVQVDVGFEAGLAIVMGGYPRDCRTRVSRC